MSVYTLVQPIHILQTPTHVTMINEGGQEVRRIWLNVPHAANPKPTWYGDSVGNYEGAIRWWWTRSGRRPRRLSIRT
jgi:hypothetical protein